jgi:hypothetical protein
MSPTWTTCLKTTIDLHHHWNMAKRDMPATSSLPRDAASGTLKF